MSLLKCLIVEDEPLAQQVLEKFIYRNDKLVLIKSCNNALGAFGVLNAQAIDLMFLDIKMPLINGIDFLKSLSHPPKIILTTAFSEYAAMSYDLEVIDYLLKPFTYERFNKSINKLCKISEGHSNEIILDYIFIKVDGKLIRINHSDIIYIKAMKDYLKVFTIQQRSYITHMTMKAMQELLPSDMFIRLHRSYIVSLLKSTVICNKYIEVKDIRIPVGELYRETVNNFIKENNY